MSNTETKARMERIHLAYNYWFGFAVGFIYALVMVAIFQ